MELATLQELYLHHLKDVYSAEKQITRALPKMIRAATNPELAAALREHLQVTERQIERLDRIFTGLGKSPRSSKKCKGMEGLLEEGAELLAEEDADPEVLDAGLIAAAQKVEHYEISAYGTLRAYAELLGESEAAGLFDTTAQEEGDADKTLTGIATRAVNLSALSPEGAEPRPRRKPARRGGRKGGLTKKK
ncbi:MAG TPA: ferritin-like domain-containing protein [Thermoanaerobaculia bacterium]|nr:ferritin-like domain-containing protein [Thermoanaerobaculia bacterium]